MNSIVKTATSCIAALALGLGAGAGVASVSTPDVTPNPNPSPWVTSAAPGAETVVSGCVIRFSNPDGTPSLHANGAHRCSGISSVDITQHGEVRVWQTVQGAGENPVLFAICQTDETLGGSRGITCGASGGTDNTRFRLYDTRINRALDLTRQADRDRVQGRNANLWVGMFHTPGAWD